MTQELDLSVPKHTNSVTGKPSKGVPILIVIVLIAVLANIAVVLLSQGKRSTSTNTTMSFEVQKKLALKLEKQGLYNASVDAWKEYLAATVSAGKEAAMIWYRIGKLYQKKGDYEEALSSYYRSESFAKVDEISDEISRNIRECLELLGKFAALGHELSDRVGINPPSDTKEAKGSGEEVVAEIGTTKITRSELDQQVEMQIDRQIAQFAPHLPIDQKNKQKEALLKQVSAPDQLKLFLNQYVLEEILYRKARESNLSDDPEVRSLLRGQERALLSKMVIEKEYKDNINITESDLETYYKAHENEYVAPLRAQISQILVKDSTASDYIREKLEKGEDFGKLAEQMSMDDATKESQGKISEWVEKSKAIPGIGTIDDNLIFSTPVGSVLAKDISSEKGVHIIKVLEKEEERQKPFEEIKNEVFTTLRSKKEQEIQQRLLNELKTTYDVVIHQSAFATKEPDAKPE
ncbi:MAG: hypothetical protein GY864_06255 [Desulfobacterales bacterium]|nr:hypothetical protein [Desulfobacterales bacterium]